MNLLINMKFLFLTGIYIYIEREEYAKNKNITIKDCFKDCFHLKPNIAYYIGEKLAEIMKKRI